MPAKTSSKSLERISQSVSKAMREANEDLGHIVIVFNDKQYSSTAYGNEAYCMEIAKLYVKSVKDKLSQLIKLRKSSKIH